MGKTVNEFCRICDNHGPAGCSVSSTQEQWKYISRGWCAKGKIKGIDIKFVTHSYVELTGGRYARRGTEKDDSDLAIALFAGKEELEKFQIPFNTLRLSAGRTYRGI